MVADEVRLLASRSQTSSSEIKRVIEDLQQEAEKSTLMISDSESAVRHTVETAQQVHTSLAVIFGLIHQVDNMNSDIADSAVNQSKLKKWSNWGSGFPSQLMPSIHNP